MSRVSRRGGSGRPGAEERRGGEERGAPAAASSCSFTQGWAGGTHREPRGRGTAGIWGTGIPRDPSHSPESTAALQSRHKPASPQIDPLHSSPIKLSAAATEKHPAINASVEPRGFLFGIGKKGRAWGGGGWRGSRGASAVPALGGPRYARSLCGTARLVLNYGEGEGRQKSKRDERVKIRGEAAQTPRGWARGSGGRRNLDGARGAGCDPRRGTAGPGRLRGRSPPAADFSLGSKQLESSRNHWGGEEDVSRSWTSKNRSAP